MKLKMKFFLVFAAAVTFCLFAANCTDKNSPSGIAKAFIDYFLKGDFDKLANHVTAYMDGDERDIANTLRDLEQTINSEDFKNISLEIISENISDDGNNATVRIKGINIPGKEAENLAEMRLVKKGGVWKTDFKSYSIE
jgi:hypothetical protein